MKDSGGSRRTVARVVTAATALGLAGVAASACSAKHDPAPGEILLAIDTNLRVSGDIDTIGLSVSLGDGSHVTEDAMFPLAPVGNAEFPATLAIVRGTSQPIKIRVVGYQQGTPISLRDTITTIPADRTALLRSDIDWLDEGQVMTAPGATTVSSLTSLLCPEGQTSVGGGCTSYTLDSATLATFDPSTDLVSSSGPQCFDVLSCFGNAAVMTVPKPSASDCTLPVPAAANGDNINIGLNVVPGHGGWCSAAGCVVPIEKDLVEGWSLNDAGRLQLPPGACTNPLVESIAVLVNDCDTYTPDHPACEVYGDAGTTPPPVGDATVPPLDAAPPDASADASADATTDGGGDAAMEASVPDMPYVYTPTKPISAFAVSATRVYVLYVDANGDPPVLQVFPRGQPTQPSPTVTLTGYAAPPLTPVPMVAAGSFLALANESGPLINLFGVADDATATDAGILQVTGMRAAPTSIGIDPLAGSARVFAADLGTASPQKFCWRDVGGAQACTTGTDPSVVSAAVDPASGMYVLQTRAVGADFRPLEYGSFNPAMIDGGAFTLTQIVQSVGAIEGIAFADSQHVAWLDSTGNVSVTPTDGGAFTNLSDAAAPDYGTFAAGSNHVAWLAGQAGHVVLAELDGGVAGPPEAVDSGEAINQVAISGADLFWTEGVSVYSIPLP